MSNNVRAQFFPNDLQPISVDGPTLRKVLSELRTAIRRGVELVQSKYKAPDVTKNEEEFGTIFSGSLGIALMFMRLEKHAHSLSDLDPISGELDPPLPEFRKLMKERINLYPPELKLQPGRPSPLCSPSLGASVMRILTAIYDSDSGIPSPNIEDDITILHEAVQIAIHQEPVVIRNDHSMGCDEVLYGRAGLLSTLSNINKHSASMETARALQPVLELNSKLSDAIMDAGKRGGKEYAEVHGKAEALPLMWPWIDNYYGLGAMHGITGILTVLLGCEASNDDYFAIGNTITGLCKICISHDGHFPMSIPPWPSSRPSPLVQICHGTPSLLLLLAIAKGTPSLIEYQSPEWDEAIRLGSEKIWEEGLLSKGGGLCHGISGNAWPWLLLHDKFITEEDDTQNLFKAETAISDPHREKLCSSYFLSRALAFLLAARDTPPFATDSPYRMPDHPLGLFEGLAGTICAWSEACAVITARLKLMEAQTERKNPFRDGNYPPDGSHILGFPGL